MPFYAYYYFIIIIVGVLLCILGFYVREVTILPVMAGKQNCWAYAMYYNSDGYNSSVLLCVLSFLGCFVLFLLANCINR